MSTTLRNVLVGILVVVAIAIGVALVFGVLFGGLRTLFFGQAMGPGMMNGFGRHVPFSGMPMTRGFGLFGILFALAGFLFPVALIALLVVGLFSILRGRNTPAAPAPVSTPPATHPCPNCGRTVQNDWSHCPYCGREQTPTGS